MHLISFLLGVAALHLVAAHPGHDHHAELNQRREILGSIQRTDLSHCADKIKKRGLEERAVRRRAELASQLIKRNGLQERDFIASLNTSHLSHKEYSANTPETTIFATNNSCVLSPEVTEGPYCEQ
jgi:DNA-binding helix-hairpin-helix protein with protein kinase domain